MKHWKTLTVLVASVSATLFLAYWYRPGQVMHRQCLEEFGRILKSPATLVVVERVYDGPLDGDLSVQPNDRMRYLIDSENSYSALIRGRYACERFVDDFSIREVNELEWLQIPKRVSPKLKQQACVDLAKKNYSANMTFPEVQELQVTHIGKTNFVTFSVSSPDWGSARFRCEVDQNTNDLTLTMAAGSTD